MTPDIAGIFREEARFRLQEEYLPRLRRALGTLRPEDLWWRPHGETTSVGALLRHLRGNVGQWAVSGLGGRDDVRNRSAEFSGEAGGNAASLLADLETAVEEACAIIATLDAEKLTREYAIQGYRVTGLRAVFHIVEHFSWHTGQIAWIAKLRGGEGHGIAFYDNARLNRGKNRT